MVLKFDDSQERLAFLYKWGSNMSGNVWNIILDDFLLKLENNKYSNELVTNRLLGITTMIMEVDVSSDKVFQDYGILRYRYEYPLDREIKRDSENIGNLTVYCDIKLLSVTKENIRIESLPDLILFNCNNFNHITIIVESCNYITPKNEYIYLRRAPEFTIYINCDLSNYKSNIKLIKIDYPIYEQVSKAGLNVDAEMDIIFYIKDETDLEKICRVYNDKNIDKYLLHFDLYMVNEIDSFQDYFLEHLKNKRKRTTLSIVTITPDLMNYIKKMDTKFLKYFDSSLINYRKVKRSNPLKSLLKK